MAKKRTRRSAEEAQRLILDAAEARLRAVGPAGIRLQEVAADVGISHPAILHHFGSRAGLVDAVLDRAVANLRNELVEAFAQAVDADRATEILQRVFVVLGDQGHARLLAWLVLTEREQNESEGVDRTLEKVTQAVHALREQNGVEADVEDTRFAMLLASLAMFADGLAGPTMRRSAGIEGDAEAPQRFRKWLARLLVRHLERSQPARPEQPA